MWCRKPDAVTKMLQTNVAGVHAMIQAFLPLLQSGEKKTVINISSAMGSLNVWYHQVSIHSAWASMITDSHV